MRLERSSGKAGPQERLKPGASAAKPRGARGGASHKVGGRDRKAERKENNAREALMPQGKGLRGKVDTPVGGRRGMLHQEVRRRRSKEAKAVAA